MKFTISEEFLWMGHRVSSQTQMKGNICRWKPSPKDWWRGSTQRRRNTCCNELQNVWIGHSITKSWKCWKHPVTNPNPVYSHYYNMIMFSTPHNAWPTGWYIAKKSDGGLGILTTETPAASSCFRHLAMKAFIQKSWLDERLWVNTKSAWTDWPITRNSNGSKIEKKK